MEPTDLTLQVLISIRDQIQGTNERLDRTNERVDTLRNELSWRLDATNDRIDVTNQRLVESEIRVSTAITELSGNVRDMTLALRTSHDLRPRLDRCEQDIADLKRRVG